MTLATNQSSLECLTVTVCLRCGEESPATAIALCIMAIATVSRPALLVLRFQRHGIEHLTCHFLEAKVGVEVEADGILVQGFDAGKR